MHPLLHTGKPCRAQGNMSAWKVRQFNGLGAVDTDNVLDGLNSLSTPMVHRSWLPTLLCLQHCC